MRYANLERFDGGTDAILCKTASEFTPVVLSVDDTISKVKKDRKTKERYTQELFRYFMTFDIESTTITPEEYMQKLDHFVTIRTQGVKQLNNQWMLRAKYDEISQYYK